MSESNWKLLARFSQHEDHSAFAALVNRHCRLVEATCRRILGDGSDADDAAQATFLKLARNARRLTRDRRPQRSLASWLSRVATNTSLDIARSGTARRNREREYVRRNAPDTRPMTTEHMIPLVDELVAGLPPRLREPIVLCYLQGLQHSQAAAQLGITVGTLRRRIQSAKSMLRSRFAVRGVPVSMFLLHILLDKLTGGAGAAPSPNPVSLPPAEPPLPLQVAGQKITGKALSSSFAVSWALKAGLLGVVICMTTVLHHFLSDDSAAIAAADTAAGSPNDVDPTHEPAAAPVADVAPPVISSRWLDPVEEVGTAAPQSVVSRPAPEIDIAPDSPLQPVSVVESIVEPAAPVHDVVVAVSRAPMPAVPPRDVEELFGIEWHTTLESASAAARQEPARPIFCFRALGELSGFM
jgi:RNA polymerase sigma factor (sigma-70 family)